MLKIFILIWIIICLWLSVIMYYDPKFRRAIIEHSIMRAQRKIDDDKNILNSIIIYILIFIIILLWM